jgi:hypothetical protein
MKMEQAERSETLAYKIQTPGNYPEECIQHSEHGEVWNKKFLFPVTEHSAKEARFDCRNERVNYSTISNVSYLHLWRALPHTTPLSFFLSVALPIEMRVERPIKLHLQHTYDFIGPLLHNITDTALGWTFTEKK